MSETDQPNNTSVSALLVIYILVSNIYIQRERNRKNSKEFKFYEEEWERSWPHF